MNRANDTVRESPRVSEPGRSLEGLVVAGSYRVSTRLGSGGMGDVYQAEHLRLGSEVAVKFMRANARDNPLAVARFRQEARRVARVQSDNIVKVFDHGELDDGTPYLIMERLVGEDLRALLESEGPLPVRRAVRLVRDVCRGLSVVHQAGLVHRDLKPANLFVVRTADGNETCKILDFGVVKELASESTHRGGVLGTVRYMAPEQLEDASSAKAGADVYALGAILYEGLTGVPVHSGATLQETMFRILHRDPKRPSEHRALPQELDVILLRALARDVAKRFSSAEEFGKALAPFGAIDHLPSAAEGVGDDTVSDGAPFRLGTASRRAGRGVSWVVGAALVTGAFAGWLARGNEAAARAEARHEQQAASAARTAPVKARPEPTATEVPATAPAPSATLMPTATSLVARGEPPQLRAPQSSTATPSTASKKVSAGPQQKSSPEPKVGRFDPSDPYE